MDPDDYVETSDVDEQSMHSIIPHTPPRKRIKLEHDSLIGPLQWSGSLQRDAALPGTPFAVKMEQRGVSPSAEPFTSPRRVDHDDEMSVVPSTPQSSQDPLLLASEQREAPAASVNLPFRSLTISPRRPSPSSPPILSLRLFSTSPPVTPNKSVNPTSDLDEVLFTPISDRIPLSSTPPVSVVHRTSPFSPPAHEKENQTPNYLPQLIGPRDDVATNPLPSDPSDPLPDVVILPEEQQQQRVYSFRQRKAEQLHPYKADALRYKMTMKGVPEAIVNKGLPPGTHRRDLTNHYEDDDPAYDGELEEVERERRRERRRQRALVDSENANRPAVDRAYLDAILPPLSDDEDVSLLLKESRAIDKRRKQEERERKEVERKEEEETQRQHRAKRFPLRPERTTDKQGEETLNAHRADKGKLRESLSPPKDMDAVVRDYHMDHFGADDVDMPPWDDDYGLPEYDEPGTSSQPRRSPSVQSLSDTPAPDPRLALHGLRPEQRKAISRMMPTSMVVTMLKGGPRKPKPSTSTKPTSDDEDGPLLPGQTRTRKAITAYLKEIKGDSETEVEISERSSSESPSPVLRQLRLDIVDPGFESDDIEFTARPRAKLTRQPEVIEISDSEPPSESEDEGLDVGVGDNDVIYHRAAQKMSRMRQERLIDYMLPRGSGGTMRRQVSRPRKPRLKKNGLDVVSGSARRHAKGSQPRLSFNGHPRSKKASTSRPAGTPRTSTSHNAGSGAHSDSDVELQLDPGDFDDIPQFASGKKWLSKKERKKVQREARKRHGVYVVQGNGTRIIGGNDRQVFRYIQINQEDPGLHYALTPLPGKTKGVDDWTKKFPPRKPLPSKKRRREAPPSPGDREPSPPRQDPLKVVSDLGIVRLPAARTFPPSTAIYNGLVYELLDVLKATKEPPKPQSMHICGLDLHAEMDIEAFRIVIPVVFEGIFDVIVALPSIDDVDVEKNWRIVARSFPRYISWFLLKSDFIRTTTSQCLETLVKNLGGLDADALGKSLLTACWFCVDVNARLHLPTTLPQEPTPNKEVKVSDLPQDVLSRPIALLLGRLLEYGFTDINKFLHSETPDAFDPNDVLATELWVSIIHLLGVYPALSSTHGQHRFWTELHLAINQRPTPENNFGGSEYLWHVIYSLCALSQYSANGITKSLPHLTACWELVVVALNTIRLTAEGEDKSIDQESLQTRDRYISLILSRCSHLRERWKWRMDNAIPVLKELQAIFRSRSFAKFHHESSDWPAFVEQNWDLSIYDPKDATFVQYLKLVYQGAQDESLTNSSPIKRMSKILLVLVPTGTVAFTDNPATKETEKSKYINRVVAAGVVYRLDKGRLSYVLTRVRNYIKFQETTYRGRRLAIEGLNHWASMLVQDGVEMDVLYDWVNDMAKTLVSELNSYPPTLRTQLSSDRSPQGRDAQRNTLILRQLLQSVGQVALDCAARRQYPHPKLLHGLSEIWSCWLFTGTDLIRNAAGFALTAFLDSRQASLPPRTRPTFNTNTYESESQEFEGLDDYDDMDFSNLPEFNDAESKAIEEKDNIFFECLKKCKPNCTRFLRKALDVSHFDALKTEPHNWPLAYQRHCSDLDMWTTAWLGTRISELRTDTSKLTSSLHDPSLDLDQTRVDFWTRRVRLTIMLKILRYHPKAYLEQQDLCIDIAIDALVSHATDWEKDYLAFVLSIGATRHPRLSGIDTVVPRPDMNVDYAFSTEEYLRVRLDIMLFLLKKAKDYWSSHEGQEVDHVSSCMAILSTAKDNLYTLPEGTEQRQEYFRFCVELAIMFTTHLSDVLNGDRYKGWLLWAPFQEPEVLALR